MKIKSNDVIKDLKRVEKIVKQPPTRSQYEHHGKYSKNTVCRRFGSWNEALKTVFDKVHIIRQGTSDKTCSYCKKSIKVHISRLKKHNFCSKSCSAKFNNSKKPKRKLTKKCKSCPTLIRSKNAYCSSCREMGKHLRGGCNLSQKTLQEVVYKSGSNRYGVIRNHARAITKNRKQICQKCGYSFHVDTCHIKEINSFDPKTKLSEINAPDNLLLLCKNCHWEMDHGLWKMKGRVGY